MTIISAFAVSENNIKVRWEEPYVSEALNKVMSCLPRGVHRGFIVGPMTAPGSGIKISMDAVRGDSFALHEDLTNGYKTAVFFDTDFELTFSFTLGTDYYVWLDVDYSVSSNTLGYIRIGELADLLLAPNAVPIAMFNSSDLTINAGDITQDRESPNTFLSLRPDTSFGNNYGFVNDDEYGRILTQDQKDAADAADTPSGSNPFAVVNNTSGKYLAKPVIENFSGPASNVQLIGWFWVGSGGLGSANKWFSLFNEDTENEYLGSDDKRVTVNQVRLSDYSAELNPSTHATDGFYENPIITFNMSETKDFTVSNVDVLAGQRVLLKDLVGEEYLDVGARPKIHANVAESIIRRFSTLKEGIESVNYPNCFRIDPGSDGFFDNNENINSYQNKDGDWDVLHLCTDGQYIYYVYGDIYCIDPSDNSVVWSQSYIDTVSHMCTDGLYLYVAYDGDGIINPIHILNRETGATEKECVMGDTANCNGIDANGKYVVATYGNKVFCWEVASGSPIAAAWSNDRGNFAGKLCIDNKYAYVGGKETVNAPADMHVTIHSFNSGGAIVGALDFDHILTGLDANFLVSELQTDGNRLYVGFERETVTATGLEATHIGFSKISAHESGMFTGVSCLPLWYFDTEDTYGWNIGVDGINCYVCKDKVLWHIDSVTGSVKELVILANNILIRDCDGESILLIEEVTSSNYDYWSRLAISKPVTTYQCVLGDDENRKPFYKLAIPCGRE